MTDLFDKSISLNELKLALSEMPETVFNRTTEGRTLLHTSVVDGKLEVVDWLTQEFPMLVDLQQKRGNTALHLVGETLFLKEGKDGALALKLAERLLDAGASIHLRNVLGQTPFLALALRANEHEKWLDVLKLLLARGASSNETDKNGFSYLHYLADEADVWAPLATYQLLLEAGADTSLVDCEGRTALDIIKAKPKSEDEARRQLAVSMLESAGQQSRK